MSDKIRGFFVKLLKKIALMLSHQKNTNIAVARDIDSFSNQGFASDSASCISDICCISDSGVQFICNFEGLRLEAYDDGFGVLTIGYGTTQYPNQRLVKQGDLCTHQQAIDYQRYDLTRFEKAINQSVKVSLNQQQFDALVSLSYNIGIHAFQSSTLLKYLNAGDYATASDQFDVWVKVGGKTVQGLVNRRAAEKSLFLS